MLGTFTINDGYSLRMRLRSLALLLLVLTSCTTVPPYRAAVERKRPSATTPRQDQPDAAWDYYVMKRQGSPDPHERYRQARAEMSAMPRYATVGDRHFTPRFRETTMATDTGAIGSWTSLGPGNIGGRTRTLIIDPRNPDVMFAGGVSGGVFKTVDGGARWEPVGDLLANLAVNSMAMHPQDANTLYVGTGEGYFREEVRGTALPLRGNGIFVTRNGGISWTQLESTANSDFHWVNDLIISTIDPTRLYAATRSGVWRSTDGGENWTQILRSFVRGGCLDLAFRADKGTDYLFASCGVFEQATVFRNQNAESNTSWESVLSEPRMSRTTLAIAPSNPDVIYALAAGNAPNPVGDQGLLALYRSDRSGDAGSWTAQVRNDDPDKLARMILTNPIVAVAGDCENQPNTNAIVPMGWHCNFVAVDPRDENRIWAGGVDLFRSDDGGKSWGVASYWWTAPENPSFVHADQHLVAFHPSYDGEGNQTMFAANDGGVYRTDNARASVARGIFGACDRRASAVRWTSLNRNFGATQFYHGAPFPDGRRYLGGAQDNGTVLGNVEKGPDAWDHIWGGDGGHVAVDPNAVIYAESQGGAIVRSQDNGKSFASITTGLRDVFLFITPFVLDPNESFRLWIGGSRMWRTDNSGAEWVSAGMDLGGRVSAIAVAPGKSDRVIAGLSNGWIARHESATTATAASNWTQVRPRTGFVSSVTYDPTNVDIVYATYAGFGGVHVWKSSDAGATWSELDGTGDARLPDIPVHSLAVDPTRPSRLYLGTDLGIFVSTDGGTRWSIENSGFASVVTETVTIGQGAHGPAIYAFTHGRGAWRAELTAPPRRRVQRR